MPNSINRRPPMLSAAESARTGQVNCGCSCDCRVYVHRSRQVCGACEPSTPGRKPNHFHLKPPARDQVACPKCGESNLLLDGNADARCVRCGNVSAEAGRIIAERRAADAARRKLAR